MIPGFPFHIGYLAIVILMVASPIPPDVFMPLAGFLAAQGELNFWLVVLVGTFSFMVSVLPWYFVGRLIGKRGIQKLPKGLRKRLSLTPARLERANQWFQKKGIFAILISFLLPGLRNLIWIPAGVSGMAIPTALICSGLGGFIYIFVMTYAGAILCDQYYLVKQYFTSVYHFAFLILAFTLLISGVRYYFRRNTNLN